MTETTSTFAPAVAIEHKPELLLAPILAEAIATRAEVATVHQQADGHHGFRIPLVSAEAVANWTAEGQEIDPTSMELDELLVSPSKVAGLLPISRELALDSSPSAAALVGQSLARAVVSRIDQAFMGNLSAPAPAGLGSTSPTEVATGLDNLDALLEAKAAIGAAGGTATALLAHPADALKLGQLKDADGSNRALVEDVATVASLPLIQTAHATEGQLWVIDREAVHVVIRENVEVVSSDQAFFSSDRIAIRGTARIGFGFSAPERLARITIGSGEG